MIQESQRYTEEAFSRIDALFQQRLSVLSSSTHGPGDS
jgi:hypothetical protein